MLEGVRKIATSHHVKTVSWSRFDWIPTKYKSVWILPDPISRNSRKVPVNRACLHSTTLQVQLNIIYSILYYLCNWHTIIKML